MDTGACHLFVDAASSPARCAAILFHSGGVSYTDAAPNEAMWSLFCHRRDKQITGLEICAIALGLSTFQQQIAGRTVFLYSDNTGWFWLRAWLLLLLLFAPSLPLQAQSAALPKAPPRHLTTMTSYTASGYKLSCSVSASGCRGCPLMTISPTFHLGESMSCSRKSGRFIIGRASPTCILKSRLPPPVRQSACMRSAWTALEFWFKYKFLLAARGSISVACSAWPCEGGYLQFVALSVRCVLAHSCLVGVCCFASQSLTVHCV